MTYELIPALFAFSLATVITPGPNNLMLMASGANFGFARTLPHMAGIAFGFPAMVLLVGLGVMQIFDLWPMSYTVLKIASVGYLAYLAWKIATAAPIQGTDARSRPLRFVEAAAFQWVNPKAWSMALTAITLYAGGRDLSHVGLVALAYVLTALVSTSSWTLLGQQIRRLLATPARLRLFNGTMALLLLATLIPVLMG
ncbi:MAG: LysE family translocator [Pseudomonadota bacterium]|nr:LysE family translocator [Pseudomonadota bacterium]MEE3072073.1 LysE family translocator [Pseudomonadota bacterium]